MEQQGSRTEQQVQKTVSQSPPASASPAVALILPHRAQIQERLNRVFASVPGAAVSTPPTTPTSITKEGSKKASSLTSSTSGISRKQLDAAVGVYKARIASTNGRRRTSSFSSAAPLLASSGTLRLDELLPAHHQRTLQVHYYSTAAAEAEAQLANSGVVYADGETPYTREREARADAVIAAVEAEELQEDVQTVLNHSSGRKGKSAASRSGTASLEEEGSESAPGENPIFPRSPDQESAYDAWYTRSVEHRNYLWRMLRREASIRTAARSGQASKTNSDMHSNNSNNSPAQNIRVVLEAFISIRQYVDEFKNEFSTKERSTAGYNVAIELLSAGIQRQKMGPTTSTGLFASWNGKNGDRMRAKRQQLEEQHFSVTEIVELYLQMIQEGYVPNTRTLSAFIQALCLAPDTPIGSYLRANPRVKLREAPGLKSDYYSQALSLLRAAHLTSRTPHSIAPYNTLLRCAAERADDQGAMRVLALLEENFRKEVKADAITYQLLLQTFGGAVASSDIEAGDEGATKGKQVAASATSKDTRRKIIQSIFEDFLADGAQVAMPLDSAVLHTSTPPTVTSVWNEFIRALFNLGDVPAGLAVFSKMIEKHSAATAADVEASASEKKIMALNANAPQPDKKTMATLITGLVDVGNLQKAAEWYIKIRGLKDQGIPQPIRSASAGLLDALLGDKERAIAAETKKEALALLESELPAHSMPLPLAAKVIQRKIEQSSTDEALQFIATYLSRPQKARTFHSQEDKAALESIAAVCMGFFDNVIAQGRNADAASLLTYIAEVASSPMMEEMDMELFLVGALGKLCQLPADVPAEEQAQTSVAVLRLVLEVALPAVEPHIHSASPELGQKLASLYVQARSDTNFVKQLSRASCQLLVNAFAEEEAALPEPNLERARSEGLGLLLQDFAQLRMQLERPLDLSAAASVLYSRYGQAATSFLAMYDPSMAEIITNQPWSASGSSVNSNESASLSPESQATTPPSMSPSMLPVDAASPFAPLQVVDEDLGAMILQKLRKNSDLDAAISLLDKAVIVGDYPPPYVLGEMLRTAGRFGRMADVDRIHAMATHLIASLHGNIGMQAKAWTAIEDAMIGALAYAGNLEKATAHRHMFIRSGQTPSADSYGALIAIVKDTTDDAMIAQELFDESQRLGVRPNTYLYNTIISKLSRARKADRALQLFAQMQSDSVQASSVTYGAVINACTRIGDEAKALELFEQMEQDRAFKPQVPPFNTMIQFYVQTKPDRERALHFLEKLRRSRVNPSEHTYKLMLDLYGCVDVSLKYTIYFSARADLNRSSF